MRDHGRFLVFAAVFAAGSLIGAIIWRSHVAAVNRAEERAAAVIVCARIHRLSTALEKIVIANASRAALLHTSYYRDHRDEIPAAQRAARAAAHGIELGDCQPSELPVVSH